MSLLELFDQQEIDLILESLEHRKRYYQNRIPQQKTNAAVGGVKPAITLERYQECVKELDSIIKKWVEETT